MKMIRHRATTLFGLPSGHKPLPYADNETQRGHPGLQ